MRFVWKVFLAILLGINLVIILNIMVTTSTHNPVMEIKLSEEDRELIVQEVMNKMLKYDRGVIDRNRQHMLQKDGHPGIMQKESPKVGGHERSGPSQCIQFNSIYYLKIQKTGSTTAFNMLLRYAMRNDYRVTVYKARPQGGKAQFSNGLIPKFIPGKSPKYNMIADHSVYSKPNIEVVLETPIAYLTLIRHPTRQLTSFLEYTPIWQNMNLTKKTAITEYLQKLTTYEKTKSISERKLSKFNWIINWQSKVLGFEVHKKIGSKDFLSHLQEVRDTFLVGLSDYYDESMIFFRRKLCLSFLDVLYVKLRKSSVPRIVDKSTSKMVCDHDNFDCFIYDHFNQTFWNAIEAEGPGFREETDYYKAVLGRIYIYCKMITARMYRYRKRILEVLRDTTEYIPIGKTKWSEAFNITAWDCAIMRVDERQFSNLFYFLQNENACDDLDDPIITKCPLPWINMTCTNYCQGARNHTSKIIALLSDPKTYLWS